MMSPPAAKRCRVEAASPEDEDDLFDRSDSEEEGEINESPRQNIQNVEPSGNPSNAASENVLATNLAFDFEWDKYPAESELLRLIQASNWTGVVDRLGSGPHYVEPKTSESPKIDEMGFVMRREQPLFPWQLAFETKSEKAISEEALFSLMLEGQRSMEKIRESENPLMEEFPPLHKLLSEGIATLSLVQKFCNSQQDGTGKDVLKAKDLQARLPLHAAIEYHAPEDVILFLIQSYEDACTSANVEGYTPLHCAAFNGCTAKVLWRLLNHSAGTVLWKTSKDGWTPLHVLFHEDNKQWAGNEKGSKDEDTPIPEDISRTLLSPDDMARIFIRYYSLKPYNDHLPQKRGKKADSDEWLKRARECINVRSNEKRNVLQEAIGLKKDVIEKKPGNKCVSLADLIADMEKIKDPKTKMGRDDFTRKGGRWETSWLQLGQLPSVQE